MYNPYSYVHREMILTYTHTGALSVRATVVKVEQVAAETKPDKNENKAFRR